MAAAGMNHQMGVHKFGGSSLAHPDRFAHIPALACQGPSLIVVSAIGRTTDALQSLLTDARARKNFTENLSAVLTQHKQFILNLNLKTPLPLLQIIDEDGKTIHDLLHAVHLVGGYEKMLADRVLSFGEQWSAQILTAFLQDMGHCATYMNTHHIIAMRYQHGIQEVDWFKSQMQYYQWQEKKNPAQQKIIVATGFIASDASGEITTLGRNGSDFSATILAKLSQAASVTIWTDVNGMMSADPRKVPSAFVLTSVSYREALELAYFGATVLHPRAIEPAMEQSFPIYIKNMRDPDGLFTTISETPLPSPYLIRGLSSIDDVALINVEGPGMVGVSGIAARVFHQLARENISVILISQGSSEQAICFVVEHRVVARAKEILNAYFEDELREGVLSRLQVDGPCAIVAVVGENMIGKPGILARVGRSLSRANVSIRAVAQGSSERNISVVVGQGVLQKALRALHCGFYLSDKSISIGLIGPGLVGGTLLQQIHARLGALSEQYQTNILVRGIMNRTKMVLSDTQIDLEKVSEALSGSETQANLSQFLSHIISEDVPHAVIIDCTASASIAKHYPAFLEAGVHVITPNKKANAGPLVLYEAIQSACHTFNRHFLYETTVCAGLPVIKTLHDLLQTGDEIESIEGIVSGSLTYILGRLNQGESFSQAVMDAKRLGLTEPDPREDLSGKDVARKFVCLAREMGVPVTVEEVTRYDFIPEHLRDCPVDAFFSALPECDEVIQKQIDAMRAPNQRVQYVGRITSEGKVHLQLCALDPDHPFSTLSDMDNMIIFHTRRYHTCPLIVRGPGAGASVTAAGVFSDLMRLISILGA